MDSPDAVAALSALAQPTRLEVFRLLVAHEPQGLAAGAIAAKLGVPNNTLSAHLSILAGASLVTSRRDSRSIIYRADLAGFQSLALFLLQDCCGGKTEICAPLIESLSCCVPKETTHA